MKAKADFISSRDELLRIEPLTAEFAAVAGLGPRDLFALQIVAEELVTNVIDYGQVPAGEHAAELEFEVEGGELVIRLSDRGVAYNPLAREAPDTTLPAEKRSIGGLGVHFCKKLTDSQTYERDGDRNVLVLRKKLSE